MVNPTRRTEDGNGNAHLRDPWGVRLRALLDATGRHGVPIVITIWLLIGVTWLAFYLTPHLKDYLVASKEFNVEAKEGLGIVLGEVKLMRAEYAAQQQTWRSEYKDHETEHVKVSLTLAEIMRQTLQSVQTNGEAIREGNKMLQDAFKLMEDVPDQRKTELLILQEIADELRGLRKNEIPPAKPAGDGSKP